LFGLIKTKKFIHSEYPSGNISYIARIWHVIFFSPVYYVGIRFKKEWIDTKSHLFLTFVTTEWLLGIGLYVIFAILAKGLRFGFIKELLGF